MYRGSDRGSEFPGILGLGLFPEKTSKISVTEPFRGRKWESNLFISLPPLHTAF